MTDAPTINQQESDIIRARLGGNLVVWSIWCLSGISLFVLVATWFVAKSAEDVLKTAQFLLTALLPVFGTWVGTVLAFYYSRENFQAATQGAVQLVNSVQHRLASTSIRSAMRPRGDIVAVEGVPVDGLSEVLLSAIAAKFDTTLPNNAKVSRLHFYDTEGRAMAILHRATWAEMLVAGLQDKVKPADLSTDKFGVLIDRTYKSGVGTTYKDLVTKTVAFVGVEQTLADAKASLAAIPGCQDAIVTQTGSSGEKALGWISNIDIGRLSQA